MGTGLPEVYPHFCVKSGDLAHLYEDTFRGYLMHTSHPQPID